MLSNPYEISKTSKTKNHPLTYRHSCLAEFHIEISGHDFLKTMLQRLLRS